MNWYGLMLTWVQKTVFCCSGQMLMQSECSNSLLCSLEKRQIEQMTLLQHSYKTWWRSFWGLCQLWTRLLECALAVYLQLSCRQSGLILTMKPLTSCSTLCLAASRIRCPFFAALFGLHCMDEGASNNACNIFMLFPCSNIGCDVTMDLG